MHTSTISYYLVEMRLKYNVGDSSYSSTQGYFDSSFSSYLVPFGVGALFMLLLFVMSLVCASAFAKVCSLSNLLLQSIRVSDAILIRQPIRRAMILTIITTGIAVLGCAEFQRQFTRMFSCCMLINEQAMQISVQFVVLHRATLSVFRVLLVTTRPSTHHLSAIISVHL